jgi:hypothetical protein
MLFIIASGVYGYSSLNFQTQTKSCKIQCQYSFQNSNKAYVVQADQKNLVQLDCIDRLKKFETYQLVNFCHQSGAGQFEMSCTAKWGHMLSVLPSKGFECEN